jgi:hypothetical protein
MALLRMQFDNILRFFGVLHCSDAHATAHAMLNGDKLSSTKDCNGKKLRDHYLVELMTESNAWASHVYTLASG